MKIGRGNQSSSTTNNNNLLKYECVCPSCERNVAAIRFAPHLEKCMGMGRHSSRVATRRIANYNGDELDQLIEATGYITKASSSLTNSVVSNSKVNNVTQDNDLMSIINAVATNLPQNVNSNQYGIVEMSSGSTSCLKLPVAKKKRTQKSASSMAVNSNSSSSSHLMNPNFHNSDSNSNSNQTSNSN
jgi:hypothetical protein